MSEKIVALDVGSVRIGVALLDKDSGLVLRQETWTRADQAAEQKILALIAQEKPTIMISGLPLSQAGEETKACQAVRKFIRRLERRCGLTAHFVDEFLTSVQAREQLLARGQRKHGSIDAESAVIIGREYLQSPTRKGS